MTAILVLEDGTTFKGLSCGVKGEAIGGVFINTAVVGYQEIMTDPANAGKILVLTYPLIGNYGVSRKFNESKRPWIAGLVIKEKSKICSNWQAERSFDDFLRDEKVVAISDVDTRTLAVKIRDDGEMFGAISSDGAEKGVLLKKLKDYRKRPRRDFLREISVKRPTRLGKGRSSGRKVVVLDLGVCNSFIRQLEILGCDVVLVPYDTTTEEILGLKPKGIIVSNGPEEDEATPGVVSRVKELMGRVPMLGISAGHVVLAMALGGKVSRMKIGHHGINYPVISPGSNKGEITVQNHSFVVDERSLKGIRDIEITKRNVNDNSIEEIFSRELKLLSVQYYPTSPGFDEVNETFKRFLKMMEA